MKRFFISLMLLPALFAANAERTVAHSQTFTHQNLDSLAKLLNIEISKLTSPALQERKHIRREMQRKCYANVLSNVLSQDGLSAIISFIKTKLQSEYSISHRPITLFVRIERSGGKVLTIPLSDDWSFPIDPWKKE